MEETLLQSAKSAVCFEQVDHLIKRPKNQKSYLPETFSRQFNYQRGRLNCAEGMSFDAMWRTIFRQLVFNQDDGESATLDEMLPESPNSENIRETFQLLNDPTIIIIDELDRVTDPNIRVALADT